MNRYRVEIELDVWADSPAEARAHVDELHCPNGTVTSAFISSPTTGRPLLEFTALDGGVWDQVDESGAAIYQQQELPGV